MKKVCHMTTVHTQQDTRIFIKECTTLFQAGYDLSLIVQHKQDEVLNGIKVLAVDNPNGHWKRMTKTVRQVYKQALECNADIYHFHDPELILIGLLLKRQGKKVIYDVHEDLPKDIYYKPWIPKYFKLIISKIAEKIERYASKKFDAVVTSTPFIAQRFNDYSTKKVVDIKNYPLLQADIAPVDWNLKKRTICYISSNFIIVRAIKEVIKAMGLVDAHLTLAGNLTDDILKQELSNQPGWNRVDLQGWVNKQGVVNIMKESVAGLSLYYPTATNYYAIPTKMFEYMMAGIPVIASNLPYETEIINKYKCGICVDPLSPKQIADAINWLMDNPKEAEQMGLNGRTAVENEFNWKTEEIKLLSLYKELLG